MAIEFTQIHNVVRTYQRALHRLQSARQDGEQSAHIGKDLISISLDARERETIDQVDEVSKITIR